MTEEERAAYDNGIWLCQTCSIVIDRDFINFNPDRLHSLRRQQEDSRSFDPGKISVERTNLFAFGLDIVAMGTFGGISKTGLSVSVGHFLIGDALMLIDFVGNFADQRRDKQFVVVNELGEGRAVSAAPSLSKRGAWYDLSIPVEASFPRANATNFGSTFARHSETDDLYVSRRAWARVSGIEAFAQHLESLLGLALGENVFHPRSGSRVAFYWASYAGSPLFEELIKMEIARLSSIPIHDPLYQSPQPQLLCVNRVIEVRVAGEIDARQRLPVCVVMDIEGVGRWQKQIKVFIHNIDQLAEAERRRESPEITMQLGLLND